MAEEFRTRVSDQAFVDQFDLDRPAMAEARSLVGRGRVHEAALAVARLAPEGPVRGAIGGAEVAATRERILRLMPGAVDLERDTAALLVAGQVPSREELGYVEDYRIGLRARAARRRGNDALICALLHAVTGERQWAGAAVEMGLARARRIAPHDDVEFPAAYSWHPRSSAEADHADDLCVQYWMLAWPILHEAMADEQRLAWMKVIVRTARDRLKANRREAPHNLTLHGLVPALQVAAAFPALREAPAWREILADRMARDFSALPFITPDGYAREGGSYQNVNARLLLLAHLTMRRGFGGELEPLRRAAANACNVQAMLLAPDGSTWVIGDGGYPMHHEHWQDAHEALHVGAAVFGRPEWKAQAGSVAGIGPELLNAFLMGPDGLDRWEAFPAPDPARRVHASAHAASSGFHVLRSGRGWDAHAGVLWFGTEHNHAHHDKGQALIYGLGRHLISDPGFTGYAAREWGDLRSERVHAMACPIRRTPVGPRTDYADLAVSLGHWRDEHVQVAMGESLYYENHVIRRALALVTPWGPEGEAFWVFWDRVSWKRGWPGDGNEPFDMIDTSFPFNAPACGAAISADGRSAWSLYDGPEGAPFTADAPPRSEIAAAHERHDSDANIQVIRLTPDPAELWDLQIVSGVSTQPGGGAWPRPVALFRWRGRLPHLAAYVLVPFRGLRQTPHAEAEGTAGPDGVTCRVSLPAGAVDVRLSGLAAGPIRGEVSEGQ